jgi:hypothetical protein
MRTRCRQVSTAARADVLVRHRLWATRVASADEVRIAQDLLRPG